MSLEGNQAGEWEEFTETEFARTYEGKPGGPAGNWESLINRRDTTVEVYRNNGWHPASVWALPPWEVAALTEIKALESERGQFLAKPSLRLAGAQQRLQGARNQLAAAQADVKDAEGGLKEMEDGVKGAQKSAAVAEGRMKGAEAEMARRHKLEDSREPMTA